MTADVRNVLAVPASRLRAFTSSPALTAAYLGNVRRAPRFAGSPRRLPTCTCTCTCRPAAAQTALAKSTLSLPPSDAQALLPVDESTILLHAFPCCAPKQPCCPGGRNGCCAHWQVHSTHTHTHTHSLSCTHTITHTRSHTRTRARTHAHRALHLRYAYREIGSAPLGRGRSTSPHQ